MRGPPDDDRPTGDASRAPVPDGLRARLAAADVFALTAAIWFLAKFLRYAFPPLFGTLRAEYGVTDATLGVAFSAMMLCYAAAQFPSGALADRAGASRIIAAGVLVAAAGSLLVGAGIGGAAGLAGLAAAMLLVGAGTGAHKTVAIPLLSRAYDRRGRALGAFDTFGTFGGVVAPALVVVLVAPGGPGWELLFLGAGIAGVALAAGVLVRVPRYVDGERDSGSDADPVSAPGSASPSASPPDSASGFRRYVVPFADRRFLVFVAVTVLFSFAYNGVVAFLPSYLAAETALGDALAGLTYSALFLVSVVQPLTGAAADRWGELPLAVATMAVAVAGLAALLLVAAPVPVVAATLAIGAGSHGFRPVRGAYLVELVPSAATGGTLGVVRTVLMASGAVAPAVVGYLSSVADYRVAFLVPAGCLLAAVVLAAGLLVTDG